MSATSESNSWWQGGSKGRATRPRWRHRAAGRGSVLNLGDASRAAPRAMVLGLAGFLIASGTMAIASMAAATRPLDEGTGQEALANAGGPGDQQVVALGDPGPAAQREHLLAVESAGVGEVDGLEGGRIAEFRRPEPPLERALLPRRPLGIDQEAEALLKAERGCLVAVALVLDGLGPARRASSRELLERLFNQHGSSSGRVAP